MKVSASYLDRQFTKPVTEAILDQIRALVESGDFTLGAPLREFERRFSAMVGGRAVVAVNSGTDALILALKALEIGPGDEVVTVPNSFFATVNALVAVGATPRFCDVDASHQMDPGALGAALTEKTRAVVAVWWQGTPPSLIEITALTDRRGLKMIEDACQAVGGSLRGIPAGAWGDAAAMSFHPIKTLNCWGDGGAVVLDDATWLRCYRDQGKINRDEIVMFGVNQRLQTIQAVVLNHQLDEVAPATRRRQHIAARLDEGLRDVAGITIPLRRGASAWRLYVVEAEERDRLRLYLAAKGVEALVHYDRPLHLQAPCRALGYGPGDFPNAERQAKRILSLPAHQYMTEPEIDYVIEQVRGFYRV